MEELSYISFIPVGPPTVMQEGQRDHDLRSSWNERTATVAAMADDTDRRIDEIGQEYGR